MQSFAEMLEEANDPSVPVSNGWFARTIRGFCDFIFGDKTHDINQF